jgi:hypothetical protein
MISMNGEDRNSNIDILILIIHVVERSSRIQVSKTHPASFRLYSRRKVFTPITQHLQFTRSITQTVCTQRFHDTAHALSAGLVVVEQVASEEYHVNFAFFGQVHNLAEGFKGVHTTNSMALVVADMVVCSD